MSSNQEDEYFCDGITEEIINALARIGSLKVTSRTSSFHFKNTTSSISEIASKLGVSSILEGSVRRSGDLVRITAQLIEAERDFHYWSETWDRSLENIFEVQDEISLLIADKIREQFGHFEISEHLVNRQTEHVNAYEFSLLARFHKNKWSKEGILEAERFYEKSLSIDNHHVAAIVGLSDSYSFMGMTGVMPFMEAWEKSTSLLERALEIDPQNAEAHYQKANSTFFTLCDYSGAYQLAMQAIRFKPNYVEAQQFLSFLHVLSGKTEMAREHLDIALGIDPLSPETAFFEAYFYYMTGDYGKAHQLLTRCLEINPKNIPALSVMPLCLLKMGRHREVLGFFDNLEIDVVPGEKMGAIGLAHTLIGNQTESNNYLEALQEASQSPDGFTADSYVFMMHVARGEYDAAFEWLNAAFEKKSSLLMLRFSDPIVEVLKDDKRYLPFRSKLFDLARVEVTKKDKKPLLDIELAEEIKSNLLAYIEKEQPYINPDLSLRLLAEQIQIHPNQLSWLLNEFIGKSFREFINDFRVEEFIRLISTKKAEQLSLLGMAYEAGFNSKTVFNTYFKKVTGKTPGAYVKEMNA